MQRHLFLLIFGLLFVVVGCADGFAPRGDDDGEKYEEGATSPELTPTVPRPSSDDETTSPAAAPTMTRVPVPSATPQPTATPTPQPTATPSPTPTATATPTPTPTPMFPPEVLDAAVRGTIGETTVQTIATDSDGTVVEVQVIDAPVGVSVTSDNELRFIAQEADTTTVQVLVTDSQGLSTVGDVTLVGRFRGHPQALVALGDSVPAGHGLDFEDYLGGDPCWRAPNSYPRRTFNALNEQGVFPPGQGEFALLACSGYDVDDLFEQQVSGGFSNITPVSGTRTQLDWTIQSNPRFVTITIGANDTGFVGPARLFLDDGVTLDRPQVDRRMTVIEDDLRFVIDELIAKTDAAVFVSNYYDPTAENPQGIPTCRLECFKSASEEVIGRMNDIIEDVARGYDPDRVRFVDFETPFIGKGAPNGLGPDGFREGGFGIIGDLFAGQVEDVHPYCARGATVGSSWVSAIDCVHPDERGTQELANIMTSAIADFVDEGVPSPRDGT